MKKLSKHNGWLSLSVLSVLGVLGVVATSCAPVVRAGIKTGLSTCVDNKTPCAFEVVGGAAGINYTWNVKGLGQSEFQIKICDTATSGCDDALRTVYHFVCTAEGVCTDQPTAITANSSVVASLNRFSALDDRYNVPGDGAFFIRAVVNGQSGAWIPGQVTQ